MYHGLAFHGRTVRLALFALAIVASVVGRAFALEVGIKSGLSLASRTFSGANELGVDHGLRTGFSAAVLLAVPLGDRWALQFEPMYVQKGGSNDFPVSFNNIDNTFKIDYLSVPVTARAAFPLENVTPYVFGGPSLGAKLRSEVELTSGGAFKAVGDRGWDLGLDVGVGVDVPLRTTWSLQAEARYVWGFVDTSEVPGSTVRNRAILLLFGIKSRL